MKPDKRCDLVMKGGVTSGVVYPRAVVELSKTYGFDNIGGTSAGAIAAAVTAAAEYGRDSGGFGRMDALPNELARGLVDKFQPQPHLAAPFRLLLAAVSGKFARVLKVLGTDYFKSGAPWALPGLVVTLLSLLGHSLGFFLLGLVLALLGFVWGIAARLARQLGKDLEAADFGLCSGRTQAGASTPALTDWLTELIDTVAGHDPKGAPLGIADLRSKDITLKTVTTDLTTHRPYTLPMGNNLHFFSEREFRALFPDRVVDAMIAGNTRKDTGNPEDDLYHFRVDNMPLIVIVRMSLSFPGLICAVPLWRYDYTFIRGKRADKLVRCRFSDGGLSSNFPVHFFDAFLPHTPTFGISLGNYDARRTPIGHEDVRVVLPRAAAAGRLLPTWTFRGLMGFIMAMFDSAKDWQDAMQSTLPGYRERIVTVNLKPDEGGLNLEMPSELITFLADLGAEAGREIATNFKLDEHRWRRYLVEVRAIDEMLCQFADSWHHAPQPDSLPYPVLATDYVPQAYNGLTAAQRQIIKAKAEAMAELGKVLKAQSLDHFPLPASRSRIRSIASMDDGDLAPDPDQHHDDDVPPPTP